MPTDWFRITADAATADVEIEGEIRAGDAKRFLQAIPPGARTITLRITSPGGDPDAALQIAAGLRAHPAHVAVTIVKLAASAATLPVMAGDRVRMERSAVAMLHNPHAKSVQSRDLDARMLRDAAAQLDRVKARMVEAYRWRMRPGSAELARLMDDVTWLDADAAVRLGPADEVTTAAPAVTACFDVAALAELLGPVPPRFAALLGVATSPASARVNVFDIYRARETIRQERLAALNGGRR